MKNFFKKHWKIILALGYLILPFDIFPDFLPVLGASDDILVLLLTLLTEYLHYKRQINKPNIKKDIQDGEIVE